MLFLSKYNMLLLWNCGSGSEIREGRRDDDEFSVPDRDWNKIRDPKCVWYRFSSNTPTEYHAMRQKSLFSLFLDTKCDIFQGITRKDIVLFEYFDTIVFEPRNKREYDAGDREKAKRKHETGIRDAVALQAVGWAAWRITVEIHQWHCVSHVTFWAQHRYCAAKKKRKLEIVSLTCAWFNWKSFYKYET